MSIDSGSTIIISVLGRGTTIDNGTSRGYRKTKYVFSPDKKIEERFCANETAFFGLALYEYLQKSEKLNVDKFILIGTNKSVWSELVFIIPEKEQEKEEIIALYERVFEEENSFCGISGDVLLKWQELIKSYVPSIKFYKIYPLDYEVFLEILLSELSKDKYYNIIFDITHAFRHIPMVFSYATMLCRYLRNINGIRTFYGAFEMKEYFNLAGNFSPAIEISLVNKLVKLIESLATYENSGYFVPALKHLGVGDTEKIYFEFEMNRQMRKKMDDIIKRLDEKKNEGKLYINEIAGMLQEDFSEINTQSDLHERMYKRACFFYKKSQYMKALILLYEAIIILVAKSLKLSPMNFSDREKARDHIFGEISNILAKSSKNRFILDSYEGETFKTLEYVRNSAVHGSEAKGNQKHLENIDDFRKLFDASSKLFVKMKKRAEMMMP